MWNAFLKKNSIAITPLTNVVARLRTVLAPALMQATTLPGAG